MLILQGLVSDPRRHRHRLLDEVHKKESLFQDLRLSALTLIRVFVWEMPKRGV